MHIIGIWGSRRASPALERSVAPHRIHGVAVQPDLAVVADPALVGEMSVESVVRSGHVPQSDVHLRTRDTPGVQLYVLDGRRPTLIVGSCGVVWNEHSRRIGAGISCLPARSVALGLERVLIGEAPQLRHRGRRAQLNRPPDAVRVASRSFAVHGGSFVQSGRRAERRGKGLDIGRPPEHDLRRIMDAVPYIDRTGFPWRYLPHDFAPWETVHGYFAAWQKDEVLDQLTVSCGDWSRKPKVAMPS